MIKITPKFLEEFVKTSLEIHENIIFTSGGLSGVKNIGLLESAISSVVYYEYFEAQLSNIVFSVAKNHAFIDGNKRSSIAIGAAFLSIGGYSSRIIGKFIDDMEDIILMLVCGYINKDELTEFISLIVNELPFYEELQLKWIEAKNKVDEFYNY